MKAPSKGEMSTVEQLADSEIVALIDSVQPHQGAGHGEPWQQLHALNIHDKHRSLLVDVRTVNEATIAIPSTDVMVRSVVWGEHLEREGLLMLWDTTESLDLRNQQR
jgi:hypothetical protein